MDFNELNKSQFKSPTPLFHRVQLPINNGNHTDRSVKVFDKCLTERKEVNHKKKYLSLNHLTNECPGGKSCANFQSLIKLELHIQKLTNTIDQLNKVNEYLNFTLNQKTKMLKQVFDNTSQSPSKLLRIKTPISPLIAYKSPRCYEDKKTLISQRKCRKKLGKLSTTDIMKDSKKSIHEKAVSSTDINMPPQNISTKIPRFTESNDLYTSKKAKENQLNHYDKINELLKKNQQTMLHNFFGISYLALSDDKLKEIAYNSSIKLLCKLASSDEAFIQSFRNENKETLIHYCDIIGSVAKDFQSTIQLIQRIKVFLSSSILLINSILSDNSIQVFIMNTIKILSCEKAFLFLYDPIADKLVVHSPNCPRDNAVKVPKDKGMIGNCFMKREKVKVDNAFHDSQFNKEVERQHNIVLRNMLCYPLYDSDGDVFGVIQAINKQEEHFDTNDEELLDVFSNQASAILQNMQNNETISIQLFRLGLIVNYSIEVAAITSGELFTKKTEQILMFLFSSPNTAVFFNEEKGLYNFRTKKWITQENIGAICLCVKKKDIHGCLKPGNCKYYNGLIDIPTTEALLTYPIIDRDKDVVRGIIQTQYFSKLSEATLKPKKSELLIFHMIEQCFLSWYERNKNILVFN